MDNLSEYLVVFSYGADKRAILLDANLERIAEYNADAPEVSALLADGKELGTLSDSDWEKMFPSMAPTMREQAVAYRLHE